MSNKSPLPSKIPKLLNSPRKLPSRQPTFVHANFPPRNRDSKTPRTVSESIESKIASDASAKSRSEGETRSLPGRSQSLGLSFHEIAPHKGQGEGDSGSHGANFLKTPMPSKVTYENFFENECPNPNKIDTNEIIDVIFESALLHAADAESTVSVGPPPSIPSYLTMYQEEHNSVTEILLDELKKQRSAKESRHEAKYLKCSLNEICTQTSMLETVDKSTSAKLLQSSESKNQLAEEQVTLKLVESGELYEDKEGLELVKVQSGSIQVKEDSTILQEKVAFERFPEKVGSENLPEKVVSENLPEKVGSETLPEKFSSERMQEKVLSNTKLSQDCFPNAAGSFDLLSKRVSREGSETQIKQISRHDLKKTSGNEEVSIFKLELSVVDKEEATEPAYAEEKVELVRKVDAFPEKISSKEQLLEDEKPLTITDIWDTSTDQDESECDASSTGEMLGSSSIQTVKHISGFPSNMNVDTAKEEHLSALESLEKDNCFDFFNPPEQSKADEEEPFDEIFVAPVPFNQSTTEVAPLLQKTSSKSDLVGEMKQHLSRGDWLQDSYPEWKCEPSKPILRAGAKRDAIEILPSPMALTPPELIKTQQLKADMDSQHAKDGLALDPSVILVPGKGNRFTGYIEVSNSTAFLQGFKIYVNTPARGCLKITPSFGFISPHSCEKIQVSTASSIDKLSEYCITVKSFRAYCEDPSTLRLYYEKLQDQHPELISTHTINNVMIWDPVNPSKVSHLLQSIDDDQELGALKNRIRQSQVANNLGGSSTPSTRQTVASIKREMIVANRHVQNIFTELSNIWIALTSLVFMILFAIMVILSVVPDLPGVNTWLPSVDESPPAEPPAPEEPAPEETYSIWSYLPSWFQFYQ